MLFNIAATTLFLHSHNLEGHQVVHSHPYSGAATQHSHTSAQLDLIGRLSNPDFVASESLVLTANEQSVIDFSYGLRCDHIAPVAICGLSLRAPPILL